MADNHNEHNKQNHHEMMLKDFRQRFWISLLITVPILILSPMVQNLLGYQLVFTFSDYILFVVSTILFFYGGWPFLSGLVKELRKKQPGMMTLIGVAISVAWAYSSATVLGVRGTTFFWELATLIDIMLLGHWIEMRSVLGSSRSLQELMAVMPSQAHVLVKDKTVDKNIDQLRKDDRVVVYPGEKIPVDGEIISGEGEVNESMVTGEATPINKKNGDSVIGGTINGSGSLTIRTQQTGEDAYLNKVVEMVRKAQEKKSETQNLADRVAFWLTIAALIIGFSTLGAWLIAGRSTTFALERMVTVMVITCPHALGLAIPLVVAISTSVSARNGLLIRNRTAFENSRKITLLAFDKTGTLTTGKFAVNQYTSLDKERSNSEILKIAASIESKSEHPLADGIVQKAEESGLDFYPVKKFDSIAGKGVKAEIEQQDMMVVSPGYLKDAEIEVPDSVEYDKGDTVVFVIIKDQLAGYITMSDEIREESFEAVKILRKQGLKLFMITGDNKAVAEKVSGELELDGYIAGVLPDEKQDKVKEFQNQGEFVAMTGDGINDAPALATADIGIAVGSGTDVAAETADIILVESNPIDIASLIVFGKKTYRKMIQNVIWASAYNIVAIPLAAGALIHVGIVISPAVGAIFMSLSTVIVAINAQLLKRQIGN